MSKEAEDIGGYREPPERKLEESRPKLEGTRHRAAAAVGEARSRAARQSLTCAWATTRLLLPSPW